MHPSDFIYEVGTIPTKPNLYCACAEGYRFAMQHSSMADVWDACDNIDWIFWMLDKTNTQYDKRKLAAKFVREIWCLLKDDRSKKAIEAIENDCLTDEIRRAANAAVADAYDAVHAADSAASAAAARAAARAAHAAAHAAGYDYDDRVRVYAVAAHAAADAVYAADAADAAHKQMNVKQIEIIKTFVRNPFTKG